MLTDNVSAAIQSVLSSQQAYCKFLSANDSGATGGHQSGILISMTAKDMLFTQNLDNENILKRTVMIQWQNGSQTESVFTYYRSKKELRITKFGRDFPYLNSEQTGDLFVFTRQDFDHYSAFFLENEEDIEQFLIAFDISTTETNRLINTQNDTHETQEQIAFQEFINSLDVDFPSSWEMSSTARTIQNRIYNKIELIQTNPDQKIIEWTKTEYALFRAIEQSRYGQKIAQGFTSVSTFISMANVVLNRRKNRAGKSLEHHLAAVFDGNQILYDKQVVTEANKKPDFIFPSGADYHNPAFPTEKLILLAAKTTCKDRWRQVLNEADRLRGKLKYLCTLQQGISPSQMDQMKRENIILVVPRPYITLYPKDRQERIWSISKFIDFVREVEGR